MADSSPSPAPQYDRRVGRPATSTRYGRPTVSMTQVEADASSTAAAAVVVERPPA